MRMNKTIIKILAIATICVLMVGMVAGYFIWQTNEATKNLDIVRQNFYATKNELETTKENLRIETEKSAKLDASLQDVNNKLDIASDALKELKNDEYNFVYIGDFKLTHYCNEPYEHICGYGNGLTATGTNVTTGRTIAVDPSVIPYGTVVYIEGYGFRVAEDCGGSVDGNHIDIAVDLHSEAMSMGVKYGGVWILVKK